jgi:hypothetical protein
MQIMILLIAQLSPAEAGKRRRKPGASILRVETVINYILKPLTSCYAGFAAQEAISAAPICAPSSKKPTA